jgi:apolipoprotein N-acyltransferase
VTSGNVTVLVVSLVLLAFGFTFGPGLRRRG